MGSPKRGRARVAIGAVTLVAAVFGPLTAAASTRTRTVARTPAAVWATVDVCSASAIGIRASMTTADHIGARLRMRFHLQARRSAGEGWQFLAHGDSGFVYLGKLRSGARQAGWSFDITAPTSGAYQLRGVVDFAWLRNHVLLARATAVTTAGHHVGAGAVPPGYSAARCVVS